MSTFYSLSKSIYVKRKGLPDPRVVSLTKNEYETSQNL